MACNLNFEFDCPQFYDFCNGVEENTRDIHCLGGDSPDFENKFNLKSKNLMTNRFAAWNNKLSTPVIRSSFVNKLREKNATDYEKLNQKKKRLSKSEGSLNTKRDNIFKKGLYGPTFAAKKSLSESDIRPKKKFPVTPKKVPATPMCLRRTQRKEKSKKLKTTEEMELEKIAELQRLTQQHLRLNEQNMKRMKLKPKPLSVPKIARVKDEKKEKSLGVKEFQKDLESVVKKLSSNRNMRFFSNQTKPRNRLGAVSSASDLESANSLHTLQPSIGLLNEIQETVNEKVIINELSSREKLGHSGLFFQMNHSKNAALKPFNFHDRVQESGPTFLSKSSIKVNKENEMVNKVQFSHSFHASRLRNPNNKENVCVKIAPKTDAGIMKKTFKF